MTKEALKLALEALEKYARDFGSNDLTVKAMYVVRQALAQPEQLREENERLHVENRRLIDRIETIGVPVGVGGFATTTSQRTWVGLTDEEILSISADCASSHQHMDIHFARAIEVKLRSKNT